MGDWLRERNTNFTFLGDHVQQVPSAILRIDQAITHYKIGSVLELGTGVGTLTCLFGVRCPCRVITVDIEDRRSDKTKALFDRLGIEFHGLDLRSPDTIRMFAEGAKGIRQDGTGMLMFVDSGDDEKEREFASYTDPDHGLLQPGDLVMCHDKGSQFHPESEANREAARLAGLRLILEAEFDADETRVAVYEAR